MCSAGDCFGAHTNTHSHAGKETEKALRQAERKLEAATKAAEKEAAEAAKVADRKLAAETKRANKAEAAVESLHGDLEAVQAERDTLKAEACTAVFVACYMHKDVCVA